MKNKKIIFATNSAKHFNLDNGVLDIKKFPDGEIHITSPENIKGNGIVLIASTQPPAENILELILSVATLIQKGARKIIVVIPYFGYARADKQESANEIVGAKTISRLIENVSQNKCRFLILDPHNENLKKYFSDPLKIIDPIDEMAKQFPKIKDVTVVAPDKGSRKKAIKFASIINTKNVVIVEKKRLENSKVKILSFFGKTTSTAVIVDDMVSSGNTILETVKMLKTKGIKRIYVVVTHMIYSAGGWKRLARLKIINKIYTTDSICPPKHLTSKFKIIKMFAIIEKNI